MKQDDILDIEFFHLFGDWLLTKERYGHALLCFHGPAYGLKMKDLLELKWKDFVNWKGDLYLMLTLENNKVKRRYNSWLVRAKTVLVYHELLKIREVKGDDYVYSYTTSAKVLTTTNLNKEFNRYLEEFKEDMFKKGSVSILTRPFKSNAFEIAWARHFLKQYQYTKKAVITVSKYLGHPSVQYTLKLLEIEVNDEIHIDSITYDPSEETIDAISNFAKNISPNFAHTLSEGNFIKLYKQDIQELLSEMHESDDEIGLE